LRTAGALYSPLLGVSPSMGFALLVPGFVVLVAVVVRANPHIRRFTSWFVRPALALRERSA